MRMVVRIWQGGMAEWDKSNRPLNADRAQEMEYRNFCNARCGRLAPVCLADSHVSVEEQQL